MSTSNLREQRANIWEQMKALSDRATAENRDLSAEGLRFELGKKSRVLGLFYELSRTLGSVFFFLRFFSRSVTVCWACSNITISSRQT